MVKILLNGCNGKMGRMLSSSIQSFTNLTIATGIDKNISNLPYPVFQSLKDCNIDIDVVLDFSRPDSLGDLIDFCSNKSLPLVLCTTGYSEEEIKKIKAASSSIPIFRSANMSLGINIINSVLKQISGLLYPNFDIEIVEKHHNQKVDAPSGTALLLAETIKDSINEETQFHNGRNGMGKRNHSEIGIHAVRGGNIVGEHSILFAGQGELIEISHSALSREVFAVGALKACEFMFKKENGLYSMDDLIQLK